LTGAGDLTTASAVLDTANPAGFTVAAWVRLADLDGLHAAVTQEGINTSHFWLGFRNDRDITGDAVPDPAWCFGLKTSDSSSASRPAACTTDYVVLGDWVSLVGVYDRPNNKIKLYVNGIPLFGGAYAEAGYNSTWSATGKFAIGRAWHEAAVADRWVGEIDHVYAVQQVWSETEIRHHHTP
jgi:hypothetical protein